MLPPVRRCLRPLIPAVALAIATTACADKPTADQAKTVDVCRQYLGKLDSGNVNAADIHALAQEAPDLPVRLSMRTSVDLAQTDAPSDAKVRGFLAIRLLCEERISEHQK